jgi:hypothetical protein
VGAGTDLRYVEFFGGFGCLGTGDFGKGVGGTGEDTVFLGTEGDESDAGTDFALNRRLELSLKGTVYCKAGIRG